MSQWFASVDWYVSAAIFCLALSTFLTRVTYHVFGHRIPLSDGVRRALRFAPAAALTAIIVPALLPWAPQAGGIVMDAKVFAAIAAIWIFKRFHNNLLMIVGGMVVFWVLRALFDFF
jgi:branched-subunit amino acid transport protein